MRARLVSAAVLSLGASPAFSETPASAVDPIVVTATRGPLSAEESLAPVTLLTRPDIERLQARELQDLLTGLPGIQVANSGGRGKSTSLFMRGTNSDHVLVLIDGIKVGSATTGTAAFEQLPVDQIERIEIVRGPRSSLYGSEAIGGIIQIFTRREHDPGLTPSFSSGAGSEGSAQMQAGASGGGDRAWYNVSLSMLNTDGIDARPAANQPDRDGYWNIATSMRGGWRLGAETDLSVSWLRVESENEFDSIGQDESENTQQVLGAVLRTKPLDRWRTTLTAGQSLDDSEIFSGRTFGSRFTTRRDSLSWQNDIDLAPDQLLSLGIDHQNDRLGGSTAYAVDSRKDTGTFAQYQVRRHGHDVQLSARRDRNEQFGSHWTGAAAWGYRFGNGWRITASHGTAFKAPAFNQLYFPGFGNPDLEPEESRSSEIGLDGLTAGTRWAVSAFESHVENLIVNVSVPAGLRPDNVGRARIRGVEARADARWDAWRLQGSLTLLEPVDRSGGANDGHLLPRRARSSGRIDLDRESDRFGFGATLTAAGRRFDNAANTTRLGSYYTVDLRAQYQIVPSWLLQAQAANVLDRRYETAATFSQPGRTVFFTVRYTPRST